ncbi:hypothetical protein CBR_g48961 [Chara braunii]|uniref:Uncharacterized protein n=1 Tax=Chara braunii TaxID=69332 RepID=A0A388M3V0_CHABU|nr:hypothetical protein CBR_g48961 [Chara braunii]|eukprot:GBG89254.1 hypothetical protein CBR_g48961 [Chara braunii]
MPILNEEKWDDWWEMYAELAFCLLEVGFRWSEPAPYGEGLELPDDEVELLIVQAWRTATEGDLLGILFGKVGDGNLALITSQLLVFLTHLVDDLPLDILLRCDNQLGTHVLSRTLEPRLLWSTCTELDDDNCVYPSQALFLEIDVTDLTLWDFIVRRGNGRQGEEESEDDDEEEESREDRDDPDYVQGEEEEDEEGEPAEEETVVGEPSQRFDPSKEDEEAEARKRLEKAEGKRPITEGPRLICRCGIRGSIQSPRRKKKEAMELQWRDQEDVAEGGANRRLRLHRAMRSVWALYSDYGGAIESDPLRRGDSALYCWTQMVSLCDRDRVMRREQSGEVGVQIRLCAPACAPSSWYWLFGSVGGAGAVSVELSLAMALHGYRPGYRYHQVRWKPMSGEGPWITVILNYDGGDKLRLRINVEGAKEVEMRTNPKLQNAITEAKDRAKRRCRRDGVTTKVKVTVSYHETETSMDTADREQAHVDRDSGVESEMSEAGDRETDLQSWNRPGQVRKNHPLARPVDGGAETSSRQ